MNLAPTAAGRKRVPVIRDNSLDEADEDEVDYHFGNTENLWSTHIGLIPLQNAVQDPRLFYGARFYNQALPLKYREAPLVRNLDPATNRSFDRSMGKFAGALHADDDGIVDQVTPDEIVLKTADGPKTIDLYNNFPYNRKTSIHSTARVKPGDQVTKGHLLATTNYTDEEGRLALGRNARIGLLPYKGHTMDDAVVIRAGFAKDLTSEHSKVIEHENSDDIKKGLHHHIALFPKKFITRQLDALDADGVVKVGTILQPGDPMMLLTRPRTLSSGGANAAGLTRSAALARKDASKVWDGEDPAEVVDVVHHRGGTKIQVKYESPARPGDKIVLRNGNKGTISEIIPDDHMPKTEDGKPLDLLLNQLGLPSRVNSSSFYMMLLGKIAQKTGKPYVLPAFNKPGKENFWYKFVRDELDKNGVPVAEKIFDPQLNKFLDNPVTTGVEHVLKLHHTSASKVNARGESGYDLNRQPMKGGGSSGGAQRLSGLEMSVLNSSGAFGVQNEAILLRGEKQDDYWQNLRANRATPKLGKPFVWDKFRALMAGSGVLTKDMGGGKIRLVPMTDKELERRKSRPIRNDGIVDLSNLEPVKGGLFDPVLTREQSWGHIDLPEPVINPAYEKVVLDLLGLKGKELEEILERD